MNTDAKGWIKRFGLTNNQLKMIAMISMCLDHVGLELIERDLIFRVIGRLAFPIFAYMIAEGCRYTQNRARYLGQLAGLGIGCQVVFFLATGDLHQGILITFSLSVCVIFAIDVFRKHKTAPLFLLMTGTVFVVIFISLIAPWIFKESGFRVDYDFLGVLLPVLVYYARTKTEKILALSVILLIMCAVSHVVQWFSLLTIPLLLLYNGERGKAKMKYVFYIFYPLHLVIIHLIGVLLHMVGA